MLCEATLLENPRHWTAGNPAIRAPCKTPALKHGEVCSKEAGAVDGRRAAEDSRTQRALECMATWWAPDANDQKDRTLASIDPRATTPGAQIGRAAARQNIAGRLRQHSCNMRLSADFSAGKKPRGVLGLLPSRLIRGQPRYKPHGFGIVSSQSQMSAVKRSRVTTASAAVDALPSASNAAKRKRATGLVDEALELDGNVSGTDPPPTPFESLHLPRFNG